MSTLPFLLSVADELDNINSQSYMDDFGLGFHPHRQYYRTPTIQLSLPASTDWMQQERQRCRTHKFIDDSVQQQQQQQQLQQQQQHNQQQLQQYNQQQQQHKLQKQQSYNISTDLEDDANNLDLDNDLDQDIVVVGGGGGGGGGGVCVRASGSSHRKIIHKLDEENIDNSVQMYNLSKKCCKNYYRHATEETVPVKEKSESSYKLQTKCMEGNNSSSDESLQKVSSSIEFLTCFLVKKTRISKNTAATSAASTSSMSGSGSGSAAGVAGAATTTTTTTTTAISGGGNGGNGGSGGSSSSASNSKKS